MVLGLVLAGTSARSGERSPLSLEFGPQGDLSWSEKRLAAKPTRFILVEDDGQNALMAISRNSASALWTPLEKEIDEGVELSWRWKVTRGLSGALEERAKRGDDYPARVLVAFDPDPFDKDARALCYVWAREQPIGAIYRNPYSSNVATIVLRSGRRGLREWIPESRNVVADYRRAFGEIPNKIYAVAVMVDTDDTSSRATAWFSDMALVPEERR